MPRYHFSLGNSTDGPVGFCARVSANSKEEAVKILQEAMPQELPQELETLGIIGQRPSIEYFSIYLNPNAITVNDIDEVDVSDESAGEVETGNKLFTVDQLIAYARGLRSEHGENHEYDRALVELCCDVGGIPMENRSIVEKRVFAGQTPVGVDSVETGCPVEFTFKQVEFVADKILAGAYVRVESMLPSNLLFDEFHVIRSCINSAIEQIKVTAATSVAIFLTQTTGKRFGIYDWKGYDVFLNLIDGLIKYRNTSPNYKGYQPGDKCIPDCLPIARMIAETWRDTKAE